MSKSNEISKSSLKWEKIDGENLDVDYTILFPKEKADKYFSDLESSVKYFDGDLAKIKIFGKWQSIPRQQVSYGDEGLTYRFSGNKIPALNWPPIVLELKTVVENITGFTYNFVLVNRYKDGSDYMGEHRDDEPEIDQNTPIASLSFGAPRTFVFKHKDCRRKDEGKRDVPVVKKTLENGSLLLMNYPTNNFWYHGLPKRAGCKTPRINLTFRKMKQL